MGKSKEKASSAKQSLQSATLLIEESRLHLESEQNAEAIDSARRAIGLAPNEPMILNYASWLFSIVKLDNEAASALRSLARIVPLTAGQNCHLSGLVFKGGNTDDAIGFAREAAETEPGNNFYVQHYASLLNLSGRASEAAPMLLKAIQSKNPDVSILKQLSISCTLLDRHEDALKIAKLANTFSPTNQDVALHYGSLLSAAERHEDAIAHFEDCVDKGICHSFIFIMLSAARAAIDDNVGSLAAVEAGIRELGASPELLMQKGSALCALKRFHEAVDAFREVLVQNPTYAGARQACFAALTVAGRNQEATAIGATLLAEAPDDSNIARSLQFLLTQKFALAREEIELVQNQFASLRSVQSGSRDIRKRPGALATQFRVLSALIRREARTRFSHSKLGYAWVIFEPLAHIGIMVVLINSFAHGAPPLGESFAIFYFTGIVPYHIFTHTSSYLMSAVSGNKFLLQMPTVTPFDIVLARAIVELATESAVALLLILGFSLFGFNATPINSLGVIGAFLIIWFAGFGMGMINSVLSTIFHGWEKIWGASIALLYFASGTFYIPRMMPEWVRDILVWNPVLQGIELTRANYFNEIIPPWLDVVYLIYTAGFLFCTGLLLMKMTRRRAATI